MTHIRERDSSPQGKRIQFAGVLLTVGGFVLLIFYAMYSSQLALGWGALLAIIGTILIVIGKRIPCALECSECGMEVAGHDVKVCPGCNNTFIYHP
jgi:hypothetical protein